MPTSDLRVILRHLGKWPSTSPRASPFKAHVLGQYRQHAREADPAVLLSLRRRATDYAKLLSGVEEQKRLRALDTGADTSLGEKEAARRSASRSGLISPEEIDAPFKDISRGDRGPKGDAAPPFTPSHLNQ